MPVIIFVGIVRLIPAAILESRFFITLRSIIIKISRMEFVFMERNFMILITPKVTKPLNKDSLQSLNNKIVGAMSRENVLELNKKPKNDRENIRDSASRRRPVRKNGGGNNGCSTVSCNSN